MAREGGEVSCRHGRTSPSQEAADGAHQVRHHVRPQQPCVIAGKAPLVFAQAHANQCSGRHVNAPDRLAAGEDEVVVRGPRSRLCTAATIECDADPLPNKKSPDRENLGREENALPQRQVAPVPGHPIDKKENMSALFLHHRFEGVDEGWRKKSRSLGQRKQAEGEEGVDALAKTASRNAHSGCRGRRYSGSGARGMPYACTRLERTCLCRVSSKPSISTASRSNGSSMVSA